MDVRMILIAVVGMVALGCAREEPPAPADDPESPDAMAADTQTWKTDVFIQHMHLHANQIDKLNLALAEGDLNGAMTPAYWLSRHEETGDVPVELSQYIEGMRAAAREVEASTDVDTARSAAEQITLQCQGCHAAADVDGGM